ncbi:SEN1 N terminal-domain-containing protein [Syncephalis plumigaleata]|nr:SEN1 N terminal-domain-containing protein [Syncephalis plumigaleata]
MTYAAPMPQSRLKGLQERVDQLRVGSHGLADSQAWLDAFHKLLIEGLKMFFEEKHSCWWCDPVRQDIVMELLHVFSLPESDSVTRFKSINTRMLSECQACTLGYYKAKEKLHQLYQQQYPPENVTRFFSILATWDESRIVNNLTVNAQSATPNARAITGALHEVLSFPKLLYSSTIRNAVNTCITHTSKSTLAELSLPMSTMLLPGLFCLVCSVQSSVRNWASDAISVRIEHANTTKWHDATQQQSTDRIISSYSKVIRYVSQSTLESPYATFTARFWRLTYKLVQSLPMDKERLFVKEHGGLIFLELAEEICRYLDNDDFAMIDKSHRSAWTSAVITFNWFASQYVDIVAYHISPEKVANIIRTIVKHFEQLQRDLDSIEGNARKDTESYINSVLGWSVETIQRLFQLPNGAKSLDIVYASIQSTVQQGNECSIYCQRQWLSGLRAICYKMAAEGVYDPLCSFIQFLDTNGMDNTFMTGMLVELIGKLVQEGISGLGQLLEISLCQKKTGQRPDRRSVACSPSIWSTLSQIQHSKARDAIINAGVATVYLWWQIPEVEHDIREHTDRITFSDAVNTLYRCFVQRVDAKPTEEKAEPFLLINGCILSMLSGVSIPGLDCTWSLYMEKLCKTDNGLDTALLRVFSQPNDQLHSIIQVSLQKFKLHYQSMNSGACSRYLRLLHAFIKSWLQSKAIPESRAHLMTIWSTLWSVLAHAIWLANKTKSTIDQREIRQRVLGIVHRLVRWQTVELKDDYVACVQLQACVPLMIGWYPMDDLSSLNSKDTHGQEAKYIDWRVPLVKAIVHTVQFISRHLGLDTSAVEATRQFVDNIKPIDGIVSHEQTQTLKRALCRKPELDLDSLLEMASDINLSDNDDVNHNSNSNSSNNTIASKGHHQLII